MGETDDDRLLNLLAALARGLAEGESAAVRRATGLNGSGPAALIALSQFLDGGNVSRLAEVLGLTHSGAVRLVGQLEAEGFIRRRQLADRRQVGVRLTSSGRRTAARASAARLDASRALTAALSPAERRDLEMLLARLVGKLATDRMGARVEDQGQPAWLCRACDLAACGREEGRCPAAEAARQWSAVRSSPET